MSDKFTAPADMTEAEKQEHNGRQLSGVAQESLEILKDLLRETGLRIGENGGLLVVVLHQNQAGVAREGAPLADVINYLMALHKESERVRGARVDH